MAIAGGSCTGESTAWLMDNLTAEAARQRPKPAPRSNYRVLGKGCLARGHAEDRLADSGVAEADAQIGEVDRPADRDVDVRGEDEQTGDFDQAQAAMSQQND